MNKDKPRRGLHAFGLNIKLPHSNFLTGADALFQQDSPKAILTPDLEEVCNYLYQLSMNIWGQCSSLVAHWLSFAGDHGSNSDRGEKISSFVFEL